MKLTPDELEKPPRVRSLDWADAKDTNRPPVWAEALQPVEGRRRVVMAADVVRSFTDDMIELMTDLRPRYRSAAR